MEISEKLHVNPDNLVYFNLATKSSLFNMTNGIVLESKISCSIHEIMKKFETRNFVMLPSYRQECDAIMINPKYYIGCKSVGNETMVFMAHGYKYVIACPFNEVSQILQMRQPLAGETASLSKTFETSNITIKLPRTKTHILFGLTDPTPEVSKAFEDFDASKIVFTFVDNSSIFVKSNKEYHVWFIRHTLTWERNTEYSHTFSWSHGECQYNVRSNTVKNGMIDVKPDEYFKVRYA